MKIYQPVKYFKSSQGIFDRYYSSWENKIPVPSQEKIAANSSKRKLMFLLP